MSVIQFSKLSILRSAASLALGAGLAAPSVACAQVAYSGAAPQAALTAAVDLKALASSMRNGGYVVVFRHAPTNRDQSDTDPLNYSDTTHQRLLSAKGREIAKQVGDAFRTLGIPIGTVYTSAYSRAVETGKLIGGGDVSRTPDVTEGGLVATPIENDRRAAALKSLAATVPAVGTNTVIVTHKPNLVDAFGADWVSSKDGEASVFKPDGSGGAVLVARVQTAAWIDAANSTGNKSQSRQVY